jgi:hypothetical protein
MWRWLASSGVVSRDGNVRSWLNRKNPGYDYPEAAALLLRLMHVVSGTEHSARAPIARTLLAGLSPAGAISRRGVEYAFDTGMALAAIESGITREVSAQSRAMFLFIEQCIRARRAVAKGSHIDGHHWSDRYGCHLLKLCIALKLVARRNPDYGARALMNQLVDDNLTLFDRGRFKVNHENPVTYTHAHCYALEGLLALAQPPFIRRVLREGAEWLAAVQRPEGGLCAWHDGARAYGLQRADATAQAIRIWVAVDRRRFAPQIDAALEFLMCVQAPEGGLYYEEGSHDVNSWATIFAIQAFMWARSSEVVPESLV